MSNLCLPEARYYSFPGKELVRRYKRYDFSRPPPYRIVNREKGLAKIVGFEVLAVLYNSGSHLYEDWSNSWPYRMEEWEQPMIWLRYRDFCRGRGLYKGRCLLRHQGHAQSGAAFVTVATKNGCLWQNVRLPPKQLFYLIGFSGDSEAWFIGKPGFEPPASLLLLG